MCLMLLTAADLLYGFVGIRARTPPELIVRQPQTSQKWPVAAVSLRSCKPSSFLYITLNYDCFSVPTLLLPRSRRVRSADTRTLFVSRTRTNFGDRAFSTAGRQVWNYLPTDLWQPDLSRSRLRQSLKIFLVGRWDQSAVCFRLRFRNTLTFIRQKLVARKTDCHVINQLCWNEKCTKRRNTKKTTS